MVTLPENFIKAIKSIHKEKGQAWIANLDEIIRECEEAWDITILEPFRLSYNFVALAKRNQNGEEVVIKLEIPTKEFHFERLAVRDFQGRGMVKLLQVDPEKGYMLLERISPGNSLDRLNDEARANEIAAELLQKLWLPLSSDTQTEFPTVEDRGNQLIHMYEKHPQGLGPISSEVLYQAMLTCKLLLKDQGEPYLLHGDFHHYNVLQREDGEWVVIDPKGLVGDREYDVIQYMLNEVSETNVRELTEKRVQNFVEKLGLDKRKMLGWGFCHSVLATCWNIEDNMEYENTFPLIEIFYELYHKK
ncbi:aminoglycoside phosphotransferase family protein [Radiobacillus kanasensis]|uniref:aminoglycoside phosphotransferase family protein n=1 Tax=Radiobacillus kanasensis TaxID=2844358 RepID=UPI001E4DBC51|nr:aminoglycoside phosphotransferase family protein [Radiobacillus kanasensis]UFT97891.1 aminoglycoside phosphotransferase family protein [Radiobacillus kanasensis]